jgi:hypothetical protein
MAKSARNPAYRTRKKVSKTEIYTAKGREAAVLRRRKHQLARRFGVPADPLGGSLNQVARRCGKPTCHCASGEGHLMWTLTYSVNGQRHVEFISDELLPQVAPLAERGRAYRDALNELLTINAQLVTLWRKQQRARGRPRKKEGHR